MTEEISGVIFGVWFLIGAALVFWMQAGFAMVEAGFTRVKNTANILMNNFVEKPHGFLYWYSCIHTDWFFTFIR